MFRGQKTHSPLSVHSILVTMLMARLRIHSKKSPRNVCHARMNANQLDSRLKRKNTTTFDKYMSTFKLLACNGRKMKRAQERNAIRPPHIKHTLKKLPLWTCFLAQNALIFVFIHYVFGSPFTGEKRCMFAAKQLVAWGKWRFLLPAIQTRQMNMKPNKYLYFYKHIRSCALAFSPPTIIVATLSMNSSCIGIYWIWRPTEAKVIFFRLHIRIQLIRRKIENGIQLGFPICANRRESNFPQLEYLWWKRFKAETLSKELCCNVAHISSFMHTFFNRLRRRIYCNTDAIQRSIQNWLCLRHGAVFSLLCVNIVAKNLSKATLNVSILNWQN